LPGHEGLSRDSNFTKIEEVKLKIIKPGDLQPRQLRSEKSGELFSQSCVMSDLLGTDQLFIHHDTIMPGNRSSSSHRHSIVDEVVYVKSGIALVVIGSERLSAPAGSFVCFNSSDSRSHYILNQSELEIETITFSINNSLDRTVYEEQEEQEFKLPEYNFDADLREVPRSMADWHSCTDQLSSCLKAETSEGGRLNLFELLGLANRVLLNLDKAEFYLKRALTISYRHPKQSRLVQNLIRLAHVYQWQKSFEKAAILFEQGWLILVDLKDCDSLVASYHQHFGKFFFDQKLLKLAHIEFETAFSIRKRIDSPKEQVESTKVAIQRIAELRNGPQCRFVIRRATIRDAKAMHDAHMRSIQQVCIRDHSQEEVAAWGHRPFNQEQREFSIKNDFVLVVDRENKIEGYGHIRTFDKEGRRQSHILGLYLTPEVLGAAVGRSMMEIIFEYCRYQKVKRIALESTITARAFYKKMGFGEEGGEMTVEISGQPVRCYPMCLEL